MGLECLLVSCLAITLNGCILGPPPEDEPVEELWPPQIVLDSLDPAEWGNSGLYEVRARDADCLMKRFRVGEIIDRNTGDTLYARWFVDWSGPSGNDTPLINNYIPPPANGSEIRDADVVPNNLAMQFAFNLTTIAANQTGATHTITFAVADRPFGGTNLGFDTEEIAAEAQVAIYNWPVLLTDSGLCDEEAQ